MKNSLIELNNCGVFRNEKWLVRGVSIKVFREQIVTLIGPNGSGKSTTAKMALGILKPDEGTNLIQNNIKISYVPQKLSIDWSLPLRVIDFMNLIEKNEITNIVDTLSITGIEHLLYQDVRNLSGGESQRVLLLRALLRKPHLLVLDEPVQGVDVTGQVALYDLIGQVRDILGCGILMVSHDLHLVMAATDEVICLNQHICCSGHPEQVSQDPAFTDLFGPQSGGNLALYNHQHNHHHTSHGDIIDGQHHEDCDHG